MTTKALAVYKETQSEIFIDASGISEEIKLFLVHRKTKTEINLYCYRKRNDIIFCFKDLIDCTFMGLDAWDLYSQDTNGNRQTVLWGIKQEYIYRNEIEVLTTTRIKPQITNRKSFRITPYESQINTFCIWIKDVSVKDQSFVTKSGFEISYTEEITGENLDNRLVISFPHNAYGGSLNEPRTDNPMFYHYTGMLKNMGTRKLFLKDDYGRKGSWFLGLNGELNHIEEMKEFLEIYIEKHKINKEDIIFLGGSKGGYSALLFGHLIGVKNIVTVVPIFRFLDFTLSRPGQREILPVDITDEVREKYNNLVADIILDSKYTPDVYIFTSSKDGDALIHLPYLMETLEKKRSSYKVYYNENPNITEHGQVMKNSINQILALMFALLVGATVENLFEDSK